ncbi:MAG: hypothetical protein KAX31_04780 [Thermoplasmata archaeon]|nr:hypothetical protein [Thermoplasmata archaeon]
MNTEKEWVKFPATIRKGNRITVPPEVMKALGLKNGDMLNLQVRKMEPEEVE